MDHAVVPGVIYSYWLVEMTTTGGNTEYGPLRAQTLNPAEDEHTYLPLVSTR